MRLIDSDNVLVSMEEYGRMIARSQKWVLIRDCEPFPHENKLICTANGGRTIARWLDDAETWLDMYDNEIRNVVAWMPLPEPYEEETDDRIQMRER